MNAFDEKFYNAAPENVKLKVESAVIDVIASEVTLVFLGSPETIDGLLDSGRRSAERDAMSALDTFFKVKAVFKKTYADPENIKTLVYDFLNSGYPSVLPGFFQEDCIVEIDGNSGFIKVGLGFDEYMKSFASSIGLDVKLTEYLQNKFFEECRTEFFRSGRTADDFKLKEAAPIYIKNQNIAVSELERICGKTILSPPKPIKSIEDESERAVLCGKIARFEKRIAKTSGQPYYLFELADPTGRLSAKLFLRKKSGQGDNAEEGAAQKKVRDPVQEAIDTVKDGEEVVVSGKIVRDAFTKDLVLLANDMSRCKIDLSSFEPDERVLNGEAEEYFLIKPCEYKEEVQQDFFGLEPVVPKFLRDKSFVVFDCETTGLNKNSDSIIELAAVSVKNGVITHTFSTLINPGVAISADITKITGITDNDVKDAPNIADVFSDFYKFTRGAALVAHNIDFDMGFIRRAAALTCFNMDNEMYDTVAISRKHYSVHNYKLGTLCDYFDIPLTGAHRAINDAIATAKLFIKVSEKL